MLVNSAVIDRHAVVLVNSAVIDRHAVVLVNSAVITKLIFVNPVKKLYLKTDILTNH